MHDVINKISSFLHNLIYGKNDKEYAYQVKTKARKFILAWVPANDSYPGCVYIRRDNLCFKRMVNPLADPDKKYAEKQDEGVYICNAFQRKDQAADCPDGPEYYEYVIPVLYLESGEKFVDIIPPEKAAST